MSQRGAVVPRVINPLWIISLFLGVAEVTMGVVATQVTGWVQGLLAIFATLFPAGVAAMFFAILWRKPYVLYAPKDFPRHLDAASFVAAMRATQAVKQEATEAAIAAAVEAAMRRLLPEGQRTIDTDVEISDAVTAVRQEYERKLVLVDLKDFVGPATEISLPIHEHMPATAFLDSVWINIADEVDAFTYGVNWVLRNEASGEIVYPEFVEARVTQVGLHGSDTRTVTDIGVRPGTRLVALNLMTRQPSYSVAATREL